MNALEKRVRLFELRIEPLSQHAPHDRMRIGAYDQVRPQAHAMRKIDVEQALEMCLLLCITETGERRERALLARVQRRTIYCGGGYVKKPLHAGRMRLLEELVQ